MTRTMADSVTATDIPAGKFDLVAGYVDGAYKWSTEDWVYHRGTTPVTITVTGATTDANVADVENGDLTPAQAADWCNRVIAAGGFPTLYFSWGIRQQIYDAIAAAGVDHYRAWVALWDGRAVLDVGDVAKQYANPTLSGAHYDLSIVADFWPGVDLAPVTIYTGYAGTSNNVVSGATENLAAIQADIQRLRVANPGSSFEIRDQTGATIAYFPPLGSPGPAPTPAPGPPLDAARAAWSRLGDLLVNAAPQAVIDIEAAIAKLTPGA